MKTIFRIIILLLTLTLIQCSSDDSTSAVDALMVNGAEFKLGNGNSFNIIKNKTDYSLWLSISEKTAEGDAGRSIQVYALHETGMPNGVYAIDNNSIEAGVANVTMRNANDEQIAGGSEQNPTGTVSITSYGNNRYKIDFNNVVLDPGTGSETSISGSCDKTFAQVN